MLCFFFWIRGLLLYSLCLLELIFSKMIGKCLSIAGNNTQLNNNNISKFLSSRISQIRDLEATENLFLTKMIINF